MYFVYLSIPKNYLMNFVKPPLKFTHPEDKTEEALNLSI